MSFIEYIYVYIYTYTYEHAHAHIYECVNESHKIKVQPWGRKCKLNYWSMGTDIALGIKIYKKWPKNKPVGQPVSPNL